MANTKSASKRARQNRSRRLSNRSVVTRLRTLQKHARISEKVDTNQVHALIAATDKAAKRGIIHRNAANRRKSQLNKSLAGK